MKVISEHVPKVFVPAAVAFLFLLDAGPIGARLAVPLAGTWKGPASDNTGAGDLSLVLRQDGDKVSGTSSIYDPESKITIEGSVRGTIHNKMLTGEIRYSYMGCDIQMSFKATISGRTMIGEYHGYNNCSGYIRKGKFKLKRK